jgi:hypothetical protein
MVFSGLADEIRRIPIIALLAYKYFQIIFNIVLRSVGGNVSILRIVGSGQYIK